MKIAQGLRERDQIDRLPRVPLFDEQPIDNLMRGNIKMVLVDLDDAVGDLFVRRDQHQAEYTLLRSRGHERGPVRERFCRSERTIIESLNPVSNRSASPV